MEKADSKKVGRVKDRLHAALIAMGPSELKPQYRKYWSPARPTTGYCYTVSEVVYHCLLARKARPHVLRLSPRRTHWFLKLPSGRIMDWTADQFDKAPPYRKARPNGFLSKNISKRGAKLAGLLGLPLPPSTPNLKAAATPSGRPPIFGSKYYLRCLNLAVRSKGQQERYGCILVKGVRVIGSGLNRAVATPAFRLERAVRQGYANHAEIEAINDALANGHDPSGAELYVAGYFPDSGKLFFKRKYTCARCVPYLNKYGIRSIRIPMPAGWRAKSLDAALSEAFKFVGEAHRKRARAAIGNFSIRDCELAPA